MSFYFRKPRYERSNPIEQPTESSEADKHNGALGVDHVTRWKRIKPKTVIELCMECKLEARVVQYILDLGIIERGALKKAMMKQINLSSLDALRIIGKYARVIF